MNNALAVVEGKALTEKDFMSSIDEEIVQLNQTGDIDKAMNVINVMERIGKVTGKAKAKMFWGSQEWWERTGQSAKRNDTFEDYTLSKTETGKTTLKRYIAVWKHIDNLNIPKEVQDRRMDDLVKIATALEQGYEFSKENWKELQQASTSSEVREILRTIKGKEPRKSGLEGEVDRSGSIWVWQSGKKSFVGSLDIKSDNPAVMKMIRRIIDNSGLKEK